MPWIKNPKGRVVTVSDEHYEFLLNPHPMHTDPVTGKKFEMTKQKHEEGYMKPTDAEIAAAERGEETKPKKAPAAKPAKTQKQAKEEKPEDAAAMEANVRDAEGDAAKFAALSDDEKEMYLELFGEEPTA